MLRKRRQCYAAHIHRSVSNLVRPAGDNHVKAIVHHPLCSLGLPHAQASQQVVVNGLRKVNVHGCAACEGCTLAAQKAVTRHLAHEGHVEVRVGVDAAGHDVLARGVDDRGALGGLGQDDAMMLCVCQPTGVP